ncbi:MAG: phosphatase PAP2 family protein [Acutalibacteraceae bacterium]
MVDYRKLRPSNITSPEFRHLLLLLYWPIYGLTFLILERGLTLDYHPVVSPLDAKIPFCEFFVFPYYFWFVFLIGIHLYTAFFDIPAFKKLMYFIILTYTATSVIYIVYPTAQELRPTEFERDNICVMIVRALYDFDTNTNVCPSLHVIGSFAVLFTSLHCERFKTLCWRLGFIAATLLICISTVFLKQHSVIDIWAALILCAVAYPFAYILPDKLRLRQKRLRRGGSASDL